MFTNVVFSYIVPAGDKSALYMIAAMLFVIAVVMGVFAYTRGVVTVRVQTRIDSELQAAIWDRLLALPPRSSAVHRRRPGHPGDLHQRGQRIVFNSVVVSFWRPS